MEPDVGWTPLTSLVVRTVALDRLGEACPRSAICSAASTSSQVLAPPLSGQSLVGQVRTPSLGVPIRPSGRAGELLGSWTLGIWEGAMRSSATLQVRLGAMLIALATAVALLSPADRPALAIEAQVARV